MYAYFSSKSSQNVLSCPEHQPTLRHTERNRFLYNQVVEIKLHTTSVASPNEQ